MKITKIYCDRCRCEISDFSIDEYPRKDICAECDSLIFLGSRLAARDIEDNLPIGTSLKRMVERYKD